MPQSHGKPENEHTKIGRDPFSPFAPQLFAGNFPQPDPAVGFQHGIHDIVFQPGAQRYMPPLPKFLNRGGKERIAEIFRQPDPQTFRSPQNDVHAAREIRIQLYGKAEYPCPDQKQMAGFIMSVNRIDDQAQPVCDHHFLKKSPRHPFQPVGNLSIVKKMLPIQPGLNLLIPAHRAGRHLRKITGKEGKLRQARLHHAHLPVAVQQIPRKLQRIIADPQRRHNMYGAADGALSEPSPHRVHIPQDKPIIFQPRQQSEVQKKCSRQNPSGLPGILLPVDRQRRIIDTDCRHKQIKKRIPLPRQTIEHQADRQQVTALPLRPDQIIDRKHHSQKCQI